MLTKLRLALLLSAPLIAGATTYAVAGDGPDQPRAVEKLDDAERADLKAAFQAKRAEHRQAMLAKYDANKDGVLDAAERAAMRDARLTERFQAMDKNGDGAVSLAEFKASAAKDGAHRHGRHGKARGRHRGADQGMKR